MKVYYAHCMTIYDTPQETRDLKLLEKDLGYEVLNPNEEIYQEGYKAYGSFTYFTNLVKNMRCLSI